FLVQCLRANHLSTGWDTTQALWQPNHSPTSTDFIVVERIAESLSHNRATQWASLQAGVGREADYTLSHHLGQSGDRGRGICPHCSRHDRTVRDIQISIPKNLAKRFGICTCHSHRRSFARIQPPSACTVTLLRIGKSQVGSGAKIEASKLRENCLPDSRMAR